MADFRALHSGNYTQDNLCAWCFDLLALNGTDMRALPLVARKLKLGTLLKRYNHGSLRYSEGFRDADKLLTECRRLALRASCRKGRPRLTGRANATGSRSSVRSGRRRTGIRARCSAWAVEAFCRLPDWLHARVVAVKHLHPNG